MTGTSRKRISWRRLFFRHWLWLPLAVLPFAVLFTGLGIQSVSGSRALERNGLDSVAVIIDRRVRIRRDSDGHPRRSYRLQYSFTTATGQMVEGRQSVTRAFFNAVPVGQEVAVRYLPNDPGVNRVEHRGMAGDYLVLGFGFAASVAFLIVTALVLREKASLIRAVRRGELREARVAAHEITTSTINDRSLYRFVWVDAAGAEGRSAMHEFENLPALDSIVTVYVDPRTGLSWWESDI